MPVEPYPDDGRHPPLDSEVSGIAMFNPVDPRPAYTEVLARCPMARTPTGAIAVFDHETITEINRHHSISGAGGATAPLGTLGAERPLIPLDIDGPAHTMYRRVLDPMFAPKAVAELEPIVRARVVELLDGFADRGRAELYGELCDPLPSSIFVDLLGVPRSDLRTFVEFKNRVVRPQGDTLEEMIEYSRTAGKETYAYFDALLDRREAAGEEGDDVIARLTRLRVEGRPLTRNEVLDTTYLLIIAGLDTVAGSLSLLLAWLAQHPEERRWITADPARWPAAIEELMRFESPVMYGSRTALADVAVGGRPYPKGTMFEVSWSAANLDPRQFADPTRVDLARTPNRHIGFASGRHRCLGSNLARLELRVCMEELHRRIPDYTVAPGETIGYTAYGVRLADPAADRVGMTNRPLRPFRFSAQVPDLVPPLDGWRDQLLRLEDSGFSTVCVADHFTGGYTLEPFVALTAAAAATTTLRVQTAVLGNDYRHPVQTHRLAATLDVVSGGRLELGLGAGWMRTDYERAGLAYDRPGVRIDRLEESIAVLKGLFGGGPFSFAGEHFRIDEMVGVPSAVQRPHPPILIGGGAPRMLRLAGREADIAGINADLSAGHVGGGSVEDVSWERMEDKVAWVGEGAAAAGRDVADLELSMVQWLLLVTDDRSESDALLSKMAARVGVDAAWLDDAPGVLVGSPARCAEKLHQLRDRLGISYVQVFAGPRSTDLTAVSTLVATLAGT